MTILGLYNPANINWTYTNECIDYLNATSQPVVISGVLMFVLLGIGLLPPLVYMTYKLTKFVWEEDKIIPLMLIALSTTTLTLTFYYLWIVCIY